MSIPKFKQTFDVEYKYFNDNKIVVAYVRARIARKIYRDMVGGNLPFGYETFKGVAKLKAGDTFDISKAEKIARKKAIRAYYKRVKFLLNENIITHQRELNDQKEFLQQLNNKITTLTDEIKEEK